MWGINIRDTMSLHSGVSIAEAISKYSVVYHCHLMLQVKTRCKQQLELWLQTEGEFLPAARGNLLIET